MCPRVAAFLISTIAGIAAACGAYESPTASEEDEQRRRDGGAPPAQDAASKDAAPPDANAPGLNDLDLNDVSILWPAPTLGELPSGYLKVVPADGQRGLGLSASTLAALPSFHGDVPAAAARRSLTVVAMRIDPCAPRAGAPCVRELRLTAETIAPSLDDAALHLVYELDQATFTALVGDLRRWRSASPVPTGGRLRVHPGLAATGIGSSYAMQIHDLISRYATEAALARFTTNTFAFDNWSFRRFDRVGSAWQSVAVPGLSVGTPSQSWFRQARVDDLTDPSGTIDPLPLKNFATLLRPDALASGTASTSVLAARDAILDSEHPSRTNSARNDCVSCHLAGPAHLWAAKRGVVFETPSRYAPPPGIDVSVDVKPEVDGNLGSTIAFGYHRVQGGILVPTISARVAAESAEVVVQLRAR